MNTTSLVPRPTPFFSVLRFPLTIIHGCGRAASVYYCQRKPKNRKKGVGLHGNTTEFTQPYVHVDRTDCGDGIVVEPIYGSCTLLFTVMNSWL